MYTIGIDIGGTNTDAVLLNSKREILAATKTITTRDIATGFAQALKDLLQKTKIDTSEIGAIFLGTTHATNAILQQRDLYKVGLLRLAGHDPESLPPCYNWPAPLQSALYAGHLTTSGGYECHGSPITPLCQKELRRALETLIDQGAESIAIIGTFSPQNRAQELEAAEIVFDVAGKNFPVSLSHAIGGVGFIERENSTVLNAALKKVMAQGFKELSASCEKLQLGCPLYITQNNGTIIDLAHALEYPVLTISAGPTNSFIGAGRLAGLSDALIVDIGGTSTDIGLIKKGFPRRSLNTSHIGGVRLNFPMPDVLSIALGGGSLVDFSHGAAQIGPQSVGKDILSRAQCFGGESFTLTDAAVVCGIEISSADPSRIRCSANEARRVLETAFKKIEKEIDFLEEGRKDLPILLVGGGAQLFPKELFGDRYIIPQYANVANAYGAALAEISGSVDRVVSLIRREDVLAQLQEEALRATVDKGADPKDIQIVDLQIIPYHYVPDQIARVIVTASGKRKD